MAKSASIEAKIQKLEEELKVAKGERKQARTFERKQEERVQNKKDILYAIFRRTMHREEYEREISGGGFDKFLTRDYERALFGFAALGKPEKPKQQEGKSDSAEAPEESKEGWVYLDVPRQYKDVAKSLGAKWDPHAVKWYAPPGVDADPIRRAVADAIAEGTGLSGGPAGEAGEL